MLPMLRPVGPFRRGATSDAPPSTARPALRHHLVEARASGTCRELERAGPVARDKLSGWHRPCNAGKRLPARAVGRTDCRRSAPDLRPGAG